MRDLSLQEKEQQIISTIICCDKKINPKNSIYSPKMIQLYESITGLDNINNINSSVEVNNQVKYENFRKNPLAYLQKVNDYLNENETNVITNLNESLSVDSININTFKDELKSKINDFMNMNDFNKLDSIDDKILKIKLFAKKPIYVYGFDIINSIHLQQELKTSYNIDLSNIYAILFDKSNKQLLFVFENLLFVYVLKTNDFGLYNKIYPDETLKTVLTKENYLSVIKDEINGNILQIYVNRDIYDFKFQDNLFQDGKKSQEVQEKNQYRNSNLFVKS